MAKTKKEIEKKRKNIPIILMILLIISMNLIIAAESQSWPSYNVCCEKTKNGAWCQNTLETNCDTSLDPETKSNYRKTPTSCDATSFCKLGCCVDTSEGLCMENTPEKVCELAPGTWKSDPQCNVPQCDLGCCVLGDQASYVTLTRCKKLSAFYGLETNFKKNIQDEATCILIAHLQDKGACVYELENERTCRFVTRAECLNTNRSRSKNMTSSPEFFKNYLCSADELHTKCGPTTKTTCIEGKDEVYFVDSCGNPANIYDSTKTYDKKPSYWQKIAPKAESCGFKDGKGNANSKTCGNCEYFKGSICGNGAATFGDHICRDINCYGTKNGKDYKNGESWCVPQGPVGEGRDLVGSRHFRHVCINGEEVIEPCADFRNEICIENILETYSGNFIEAACRPNRWKDCLDQEEKDDCLNTDKRDCYWFKGAKYVGNAETTGTASSDTGEGTTKKLKDGGEMCLPNFPAGFQFWNQGDAKTVCSLGNIKEEVTYEKGLISKKKCVKNCEVLNDEWARKMNNVCTSLGDCGAYINIAGRFTDKGVQWKQNGAKKVIQGLLGSVKAKAGA